MTPPFLFYLTPLIFLHLPIFPNNLPSRVEEGITDLYVAGLALLGGILALHGRIKAD
jgi:hypothetical protein